MSRETLKLVIYGVGLAALGIMIGAHFTPKTGSVLSSAPGMQQRPIQ